MSSAAPRVLAIILAYNEAGSIRAVLSELRACLPSVDVVVINDGSADNTSFIARGFGASVIDLPVNLGIGGAVQTGLIFANREGYDAAFQMDGDGQHLASQVDRLVAPVLADEQDAVIGSRFLAVRSYRVPRIRHLGIRALNAACTVLTGIKITDATSGFRAYNRAAIAVLADDYPQDYPEPEAIIMLRKRGLRIGEVAVAMQERRFGQSSITPVRSAYYMIKVLLAVLIRSLGPAEVRG